MTAADVLAGRAAWSAEAGDCLAWLRSLPGDSADLLCGSPPYSSARSYGLVASPPTGQAWADWMAAITREALRVVRGPVVWVVQGVTRKYRWSAEPVLLMADLHRAGVCLRNPLVYARSGIPGSGGPDYFRGDHEFVLVATRGGKLPWADPTACGHPPKCSPGGPPSHRRADGTRVADPWRTQSRGGPGCGGRRESGEKMAGPKSHTKRDADGTMRTQVYRPPKMANPGTVIRCKVGGGQLGSPLAHENEAPFPESLVERFVRSWCPPGGVVLDPFCGSGTTLAVAARWGRRAAGCDLRASQVELTGRRMDGFEQGTPTREAS